MAETLDDLKTRVSGMLAKARAMHRAGNEAAAGTLRRKARAEAFVGVAAAQDLRDAFARLAADTVEQHGADAASLAATRLGGEAA